MKQKSEKPRGFVFYTQDYFGDIEVRAMPSHLRIVWVECLFLMDQSPRRGVLLQKNGTPYTAQKLAKILNCPVVEEALKYVVDEHIAGVDPETNAIISRKMVRDEKKRKTGSKMGKKGGGNPKLKDAPTNSKTKDLESTFKGTYKGDLYTTEPEPEPEPEPDSILTSTPNRINPSVREEENAGRAGGSENLKSGDAKSGGRNGLKPETKTGPTGNGRETRATPAMLVKIWAPIAQAIRKSTTSEAYEKYYAGARILALDGTHVTVAVQESWIKRQGSEAEVGLQIFDFSAQAGVDLLREGRQFKIISIESVVEGALKS